MKKHLGIVVFVSLASGLHAQDTPFFNDDFDSNKNNWFTD
jgi:hypothetical protein